MIDQVRCKCDNIPKRNPFPVLVNIVGITELFKKGFSYADVVERINKSREFYVDKEGHECLKNYYAYYRAEYLIDNSIKVGRILMSKEVRARLIEMQFEIEKREL